MIPLRRPEGWELLMGARALVRRRLGIDVRRVHVQPRGGTQTVHSNFDEQQVIADHLARFPPAERFVVDIGAADGEVSSNSLSLLQQGWAGVSCELDGDEFSRLARTCAPFRDAQLVRCRVTPGNVVALLQALGVPSEPGLLSLDIDGYDHEVLDAVLGSFRPGLVVTEINEKIPPPVRFHVHYREDYAWRSDHYYGHSLASVADLAQRHGYALVAVEYNNAFLAPDESGRAGLDAATAYRQGYLDRPDRLRRLPWNRDVEHLQSLPPEAVVDELRTRFADRAGQFSLSADGG